MSPGAAAGGGTQPPAPSPPSGACGRPTPIPSPPPPASRCDPGTDKQPAGRTDGRTAPRARAALTHGLEVLVHGAGPRCGHSGRGAGPGAGRRRRSGKSPETPPGREMTAPRVTAPPSGTGTARSGPARHRLTAPARPVPARRGAPPVPSPRRVLAPKRCPEGSPPALGDTGRQRGELCRCSAPRPRSHRNPLTRPVEAAGCLPASSPSPHSPPAAPQPPEGTSPLQQPRSPPLTAEEEAGLSSPSSPSMAMGTARHGAAGVGVCPAAGKHRRLLAKGQDQSGAGHDLFLHIPFPH